MSIGPISTNWGNIDNDSNQNHGELVGLEDDDHPHYAQLDARSGDVLQIDTISEDTLNNGVVIEGSTLKDNGITTTFMDIVLPGDDELLIDGATNARTITTGIVRVNHQAGINSTRCLHLEMDPSTFDDSRSITCNWDLSNDAVVQNVNGYFMTTDITGATNKHINYVHAEKVGDLGSGMIVSALHVQNDIDVIEHMSGGLIAIELAYTYDGAFVDVTPDFNSTGSDVTMFVDNGDIVYVGKAVVFDTIEWTLATVASAGGIQPLFEYSDGVGTWATLSATDTTLGFRASGTLSWSNPAGWSSEDVNGQTKFWIRITRQRTSLATSPIEDIVKYQSSSEFAWDASGDLTINDLSGASTDLSGTLTVDTINESTTDAGIDLEGGHIENGKLSLGTTAQVVTGQLRVVGTDNHGVDGSIANFFTSDELTNARLQIYALTEGHQAIAFDCWDRSDNILVSSNASSNFRISKFNDTLSLDCDSGVAVGNALSLITGLSMDADGNINLPISFDLNSSTQVSSILDEDTLVSDSATALVTQQSVKTYVDTRSGQEWGGFASSVLNVTGDNTNYTIVWDNEEFDEAGIFTSAGVTVTVAGTYQVNVDVDISGVLLANHSRMTMICTAGGVTYTNIQAIGVDGQHHVQLSFVCKLVATNTIITTMQVAGDSKVVDISANTRFSGHLIKAT